MTEFILSLVAAYLGVTAVALFRRDRFPHIFVRASDFSELRTLSKEEQERIFKNAIRQAFGRLALPIENFVFCLTLVGSHTFITRLSEAGIIPETFIVYGARMTLLVVALAWLVRRLVVHRIRPVLIESLAAHAGSPLG